MKHDKAILEELKAIRALLEQIRQGTHAPSHANEANWESWRQNNGHETGQAVGSLTLGSSAQAFVKAS